MKVLMLIKRLNVGGTETYILSLARKLRKMGVQVGVAAFGGALVPVFRQSGIPVHLIPRSKRVPPHVFIRRLAQRRQYGVLHAHDSSSFRWVSAISRTGPNSDIVMTLHGKYLNRIAVKRAAIRAKSVVGGSPEMVAWGKRHGVDRRKLHLAPNGIETDRFKPNTHQQRWKSKLGVKAGDPVIVYAGRFQSSKHLVAKKLILSAARIVKSYPKSVIVLTGPGTCLRRLKKLGNAVNAKQHRVAVIVRAAMRDVRQLYWAGDLVIGTGRVALEAMACGKPVLAVGVAGYSGPVTRHHMQRAIRSHFGDHRAVATATPAIIAAGILKMLSNRRRLGRLSRTGRDTVVRRFSAVTTARRMLQLYRS